MVCDVTFSLTSGAEAICAANFSVPYPNAAVSYASVSDGTINSSFTIAANNHNTWVEFTSEGAPPGATGPGSFAVLHFKSLTCVAPAQSAFTPSSANFANCAIPPAAIDPAWSFGMNCH
jgi:hypothetical protein